MTADTRPAPLARRARLTVAVRVLLALGVAATAFVAMGVFVRPTPAACACDCPRQTIAQSAAKSDTVFTGTLVDIEQTARPGVLAYTVRADRLYKGSLISTEATFTSAESKDSCGLGRLPVDEQYLVFVSGSAGSWTADSCGGTARLDGNTQRRVAAVLGVGHALHAPAAQPFEVDFTPVDTAPPPALAELVRLPAAVSLSGLLLLVLAGLLGRKRA